MNMNHSETPADFSTHEVRKILVVSSTPSFSEEIITYAVHLAERLDYGILALNVDTSHIGRMFHQRAVQSMMGFMEKAFDFGIICEHSVKQGLVVNAIEVTLKKFRRIEMVVTDSAVDHTELIRDTPIPIFKVIPNTVKEKGEKEMPTQIESTKSGHLAPTIGFGIAAAAMYAGVFMNSDTVMSYFTRGGWYAALPIVTVFAFSFIHGSFASHLWSLMGIEAVKKDALRKTEKKAAQPQKRAGKRPRAYAYINPFHRI
jgi:hypothetical protein